ncbi:GNAT family N-acetyltransferase [Acidothermaceae bacterium B102]|nr:GNAT family N-acetyltransferase [Acidothermaceae bacterium B102]
MCAEARLLLEPLRVDHAAEMVTVLAAPTLYRFTGGTPPTLSELEKRYRHQVAGSPDGRENWHNWVLRRTTDGRAVGFVQATVSGVVGAESAAVAWVIGAGFQGQGYAKEAAALLVERLAQWGVTAYTADIHPDHAASQTVARSIGLAPTRQMVAGEVRWRSS